jgi:hypothetical protein
VCPFGRKIREQPVAHGNRSVGQDVRVQAGVSAEGVVPVPATAGSLTCLVYCEHAEQILSGSEPRALMDNWFRGPRRMRDVTDALRGQGVDLPSPRPLYRDIDFKPTAAGFTGWFSARFGHTPSRDAVDALAEEWLEGMLPGTKHAVSPHRSRGSVCPGQRAPDG